MPRINESPNLRNMELADEVEQLTVQLAGVLTIAEGWAGDLGNECYGYSAAFEAVRILRHKYETALQTIESLQAELELERAKHG